MSGSLRPKLACQNCSKKKVRCNKHIPCDNCIKRRIECHRLDDVGSGQYDEQLPVGISAASTAGQQERTALLLDNILQRVEMLEEHIYHRANERKYSDPAPPPPPLPQNPVQHTGTHAGTARAYGRKNSTVQLAVPEKDTEATLSGMDEIFAFESNRLSFLQQMIPTKRQVIELVDYHIEGLLWIHTGFHAPTFRRELDTFCKVHDCKMNFHSDSLQWNALLFAIMSGSIICARDSMLMKWGYQHAEQRSLAERWHWAAIQCLEVSQYMSNHSLYSVEAIVTLSMAAYGLAHMKRQSVLMATGVRISQSLGMHELGKSDLRAPLDDIIENETKCRVWYTLVRQDYFFIPFSESYQVNRLFNITPRPMNCREEDMMPVNDDVPTITAYCSFLDEVAIIMSELHDALKRSPTLYGQYEETLRFDTKMRTLATIRRPPYFGSVPSGTSWPVYITWAREMLTISSAHKIIMIHRKFIGRSFVDPAFSFTRRTCVAAAKTIIKAQFEKNDGSLDERPLVWTEQAFSVTACVILCFDILYRPPGERECLEQKELVERIINKFRNMDQHVVAQKGFRLLRALLMEAEDGYAATINRKRSHPSDSEDKPATTGSIDGASSETRSLGFIDVDTFVRRFWRRQGANKSAYGVPSSRDDISLSPEQSIYSAAGSGAKTSGRRSSFLVDRENSSFQNYMLQDLFDDREADALLGPNTALFWPASKCINVEEPPTLLISPNAQPGSTPSFEDLLFRAENFDF